VGYFIDFFAVFEHLEMGEGLLLEVRMTSIQVMLLDTCFEINSSPNFILVNILECVSQNLKVFLVQMNSS